MDDFPTRLIIPRQPDSGSFSTIAISRNFETLFRQADALSHRRQTRIAGKQRRQFRRIQVLAGALRAAARHPLQGIDRPIFVAETGVAAGDRTMTAQVPMGRIPTLYGRTGDWFSWLCVAGLAAMLAVVMIGTAQRSVIQFMTRELFVFGRTK